MTSQPRGRTATILPFPAGGRASRAPAGTATAPAVPTVSFGSGWYHEAAIKAAAKDVNVRPFR